jgi:hypothetical protein
MKFVDLATLARLFGGEYVLGKEDLGTHGCYMIFGKLMPQETGRLVQPGKGYEEIFCSVDGSIAIHTDRGEVRLEPGHAVFLKDDESLLASNPDSCTVTYVVAGSPIMCASVCPSDP